MEIIEEKRGARICSQSRIEIDFQKFIAGPVLGLFSLKCFILCVTILLLSLKYFITMSK